MGNERVASRWRERDVPQAYQALALRRGIASDEQLGLPWAPSQSLSEEFEFEDEVKLGRWRILTVMGPSC